MKLTQSTGIYKHDGMYIPVHVHEVKNTYGKIRYTIQPIGGTGRATKEAVTLDSDYKHLLLQI